MSLHRTKRYTIDHEGMQRVSVLGVIDPETGGRAYWQPDQYLEILQSHLDTPGFDLDKYCSRCQSYDDELGINEHQLRLPVKAKREVVNWERHSYPLPWQPAWPGREAHLRAYHKSRPGRPMTLGACHMCLFSFLDPVDTPPVSDEERREWQALARRSRDEYYRLRKVSGNPANSEEFSAYVVRLLESAKVRLRIAIRCCRERGFEPWRWGARREGDEGPAEVVATEWVRAQ